MGEPPYVLKYEFGILQCCKILDPNSNKYGCAHDKWTYDIYKTYKLRSLLEGRRPNWDYLRPNPDVHDQLA